MKILAIPATNSRDGINRKLIGTTVKVIEANAPDAEIEIVDINDYEMQIFSVERQEAGLPDLAQQFWDLLGSADAIVISFAEHNGSYSAAWKNIHDWVSRIDMGIYQGAKVAMLAATPGPRGGAGVLGGATMTAPFFGAELVGSLGIGTFFENFDPAAGEITNDELKAEFTELLGNLTKEG